MGKKTDNRDLQAKLALRRYFLEKYHADQPAHVLDCCQGSGRLWETLRREFTITSYWGLDVKPKRGRLKIDSSRVLAQPGWTQNVIDIDTYGSPWKHWLALLPNVSQSTTVFLTVGKQTAPNSKGGLSDVPKIELEAAGCTFPTLTVPFRLRQQAGKLSASYLLTRRCDNCMITEAVEAVSDGNTRYIGVRLENANGQGSESPPAVLNTTTVRSNGHA